MPETIEELKALIREEIEKEITKNLSISYEEGDTVYGEKEPGTLTICYKGNAIYTGYV